MSAFDRLLAGDAAALARALSLLEAGGAAGEALGERLRAHAGRALIVGFTGPPGAGKSTLINAYVHALREHRERVAVLAVDPSSPVSRGAILGDRCRMGAHTADPGVFIRSVAARGHLGGLSLCIPAFLDAVDAAGWPKIILETVGTGQSEVEVAGMADVNVVVNAPGLGDEVQAMKAGVFEIADMLVVNKCDLPGADVAARQLEGILDKPVVRTSATRRENIGALADAIRSRAAELPPEARVARRTRGLVWRAVEASLRARLVEFDPARMDKLCADVRCGRMSLNAAVDVIVRDL